MGPEPSGERALLEQMGASAGEGQEFGTGFLHVAESQMRTDELHVLCNFSYSHSIWSEQDRLLSTAFPTFSTAVQSTSRSVFKYQGSQCSCCKGSCLEAHKSLHSLFPQELDSNLHTDFIPPICQVLLADSICLICNNAS